MASFVPDTGDVVWLDFDSQAGREQGGRQLVLVLSRASYNEKLGLMICCPMTSQMKGYPFEVAIAGSSAVLADQVKTFDWRHRKAARKSKASEEELAEVRGKILALIG